MQPHLLQEFLIRHLLRQHHIATFDYSGLKQLAAIINQETEQSLSLNTLARIAGLRNDRRKTYIHTLDILSRAGNFFNYHHFTSFITTKSALNINNHHEPMNVFLTDYTYKAVASGDLSFLKAFIGHIEKNGCTLDVMFHCSEAIVKGLRENKNPQPTLKLLASSPVAIELVFDNQVDVDFFAGYYGAAMVELSKHTKETDRHFIFSNAIALRYEKANKLHRNYKKRGRSMAAYTSYLIENSIKKGHIYPMARWASACADYLFEERHQKEMDILYEQLLSSFSLLNSDDQMIVLSELSENTPQLPVALREKMTSIFIAEKKSVLIEFDSLVNAGVNFSLINGKNPIISKKEIDLYSVKYPQQFTLCKQKLVKKTRQLYR
jgi:hypothetical protein